MNKPNIPSIFSAGTVFFWLMLCFTSCERNTSCSECTLEPDPGDCLAAIPKYYFNPNTGQCEQFIWGGCGGVVPFDTLEECQECDCE